MMRGTSRGSLRTRTTSSFDRHVGARADGDGDIRGEQRGRVVHAITHHGDPIARSLELLDLVDLVARQNLGKDRVDSEIRGHRLGYCRRVAGQHHDFDLLLMEPLNRLA